MNEKIGILNLFHESLSLLTSSSIFIALNALFLTAFSFILYGIPIDIAILASSFLITFFAYSFNKLTDSSEDRINDPVRFRFIEKRRKIWMILSFTALFSSFGIGFLKDITIIPILFIPFISAFFYSTKFSNIVPRLKEVCVVKSLIVAGNWALVSTLLPLTVKSVPFSSIFMIYIFIFITLFVNTVLFDIRDMGGDIANRIKTIPIVLGNIKTKKLLFLINSLLIIWLFFSVILNKFLIYIPALILCTGYEFFLIKLFCKDNGNRLLHEMMIDGEWSVFLLLMAVTNFFLIL